MAYQEGDCKWSFLQLQGNELYQDTQNAIISHFEKSPYYTSCNSTHIKLLGLMAIE